MSEINTDSNFWVMYPELKFVPGIGELYTRDKSKKKEKSSKIMWAVYMCEHPSSKLYNRPNKYEEVANRFMKNEVFSWDDHEEVIESFKDTALTDAQRALSDWNELMKFRKVNLRRLYMDAIADKSSDEIDTKALKELDAMLAATPKLFDDYKKVKSDFEEELVHLKGKRVISASDSDEI